MSLRYLLDTNILSEPSRLRPDSVIIDCLTRYQGEVATASVVWQELVFGTHKLPESARRRALEEYLSDLMDSGLPILPYDEWAASWHALQRVRLCEAGATPPYADAQIAAVAAVNKLVLVTRNVKDYRRFRDLQVTDWKSASS